MTQKTKKIINWSLTGIVGFIFIGSAMSKFFGGDDAVQMAQGIGLDVSNFKIIGIVELISIILFIIPRTGVLGTLLLAAYMGGAIAAHATHGQSIMAPVFIQAGIWIVAVVRFPELRSRLFNKP
jgi:hypothetical protein